MKKFLPNTIYGKAAPLAAAIAYACAAGAVAETQTSAPLDIAKNVEFDSIFLNMEDKNAVDLSRFANGASALPGTYRTLVYVNGEAAMTADVEVRSRSDKSAYPCLDRNLIKLIPFNYERLPSGYRAAFSTVWTARMGVSIWKKSCRKRTYFSTATSCVWTSPYRKSTY